MKKLTSKPNDLRNLLEKLLLIAVIAGTTVAIQTQQIAWGFIPIAIALIINNLNRKKEQRSQQHRSHHLETLLQSSETEQENQQINFLDLQKQIQEVEQVLTEWKETHTQNWEDIQGKVSDYHQFKTTQDNQLKTLQTQLSEIQDQFNQLQKVATKEFSNQEQIKNLNECLQQLTELLDAIAQRQTEESQVLKTKLSELQLKFNQSQEID